MLLLEDDDSITCIYSHPCNYNMPKYMYIHVHVYHMYLGVLTTVETVND